MGATSLGRIDGHQHAHHGEIETCGLCGKLRLTLSLWRAPPLYTAGHRWTGGVNAPRHIDTTRIRIPKADKAWPRAEPHTTRARREVSETTVDRG